jgi:hypothetical protein
MSEQKFQIATICGCVDHSLSFILWCEDFASVIGEDIIHVDKAFDVVSDATRLHSLLALRKLDDFLGGVSPKPDDLTSDKLNLNKITILGNSKVTFLDAADRTNINKGVAHLTEMLTLDADSEVDLVRIIRDSIPIFEKLIFELKRVDVNNEAGYWLDNTGKLVQRVKEL